MWENSTLKQHNESLKCPIVRENDVGCLTEDCFQWAPNIISCANANILAQDK